MHVTVLNPQRFAYHCAYGPVIRKQSFQIGSDSTVLAVVQLLLCF